VDKKKEKCWASAQKKILNIWLKPIFITNFFHGLKPVAIGKQHVNRYFNNF
jgi:hypothetical protein